MHIIDTMTSLRIEIIASQPHVLENATTDLGTMYRFLPVVERESIEDGRSWYPTVASAHREAFRLASK